MVTAGFELAPLVMLGSCTIAITIIDASRLLNRTPPPLPDLPRKTWLFLASKKKGEALHKKTRFLLGVITLFGDGISHF